MQRVAVEVGVHGDGRDAQLLAGPDDPDGDLATVGDQHLGEHAVVSIAVMGDDAIPGPAVAPGTRFADVRWVAETGSTNTDVMVARARHGRARGRRARGRPPDRGARPARPDLGRAARGVAARARCCCGRPRPAAAAGDLRRWRSPPPRPVDDVAGFRPGLKWPNDLVVGRRRAASGAPASWPGSWPRPSGRPGRTSLQATAAPAAHERATVAAGIGLNVSWPDELPDDLADVAVAINHVSAARPTRDQVLDALLDRLDVHYGALVRGDVAAVLDSWRARSVTLGREVRIDLGADDLVGTALDVTSDGHLVVEPLEGGRRTIAVGDVVHLRPVGQPNRRNRRRHPTPFQTATAELDEPRVGFRRASFRPGARRPGRRATGPAQPLGAGQLGDGVEDPALEAAIGAFEQLVGRPAATPVPCPGMWSKRHDPSTSPDVQRTSTWSEDRSSEATTGPGRRLTGRGRGPRGRRRPGRRRR